MKKIGWHILFWIVIYVCWSYMKSAGTFHPNILKINLLNMAIYISAYYFLRYVQLPKLFSRQRYMAFLVSILGTSVFFYTIWRIAGVLYIDAIYHPNREVPFMTLATYLTQTIQFYSPAILLLAWEFYQERQATKLKMEQLEKEKLATELKYLKAQINPHFLFNTLNNLYSFVINQSPKAADIIIHLSEMLDYILYKSQKISVPLKEELDCIENFLALEKTRYGDRLQVEHDFTGNLDLPIAPLVLLSLVENAFKHGASGDLSSPHIKIHIETNGESIICKIWNTKSPFLGSKTDAYKVGIGLSNIKRQLKLIYPQTHKLTIFENQESFNVDLLVKTAA